MADITITIPNAQLTRVVNAVSTVNGYEPFLRDSDGALTIPNSETRTQFARRMIIEYAMNCVRQLESKTDAEASRQAAINKVNMEVTIT